MNYDESIFNFNHWYVGLTALAVRMTKQFIDEYIIYSAWKLQSKENGQLWKEFDV